jgi:squalene synthase HpnC
VQTSYKNFKNELAQWGPENDYRPPLLAEAQAYCRELATAHYENFHVVSWLLPKPLRQHFFNIYAYCRWSDDLADETGSAAESSRLLAWWEEELRRAFEGKCVHPVFVALEPTIAEFQLSEKPFADLLSAFRQDQVKLRYRSDEEVLDYCRRSANPVGYLVLALGRSLHADAIAWSDSICTGLQIANFCQDIAIDARKNRIYIPASRLSEYGVTEDDVLAGRPSVELKQLLQRWCEYADTFFDRGSPLVKHVPRWLSLDIYLFIAGGREILREIRRQRFDVWSQRVSLSKSRKLSLVAGSTWRWLVRGSA